MITQKEIAEVNQLARQVDESHLWPVRGRFNVTERAIRKARQYRRDAGECETVEDYESLLALFESEIVNTCL